MPEQITIQKYPADFLDVYGAALVGNIDKVPVMALWLVPPAPASDPWGMTEVELSPTDQRILDHISTKTDFYFTGNPVVWNDDRFWFSEGSILIADSRNPVMRTPWPLRRVWLRPDTIERYQGLDKIRIVRLCANDIPGSTAWGHLLRER